MRLMVEDPVCMHSYGGRRCCPKTKEESCAADTPCNLTLPTGTWPTPKKKSCLRVAESCSAAKVWQDRALLLNPPHLSSTAAERRRNNFARVYALYLQAKDGFQNLPLPVLYVPRSLDRGVLVRPA